MQTPLSRACGPIWTGARPVARTTRASGSTSRKPPAETPAARDGIALAAACYFGDSTHNEAIIGGADRPRVKSPQRNGSACGRRLDVLVQVEDVVRVPLPLRLCEALVGLLAVGRAQARGVLGIGEEVHVGGARSERLHRLDDVARPRHVRRSRATTWPLRDHVQHVRRLAMRERRATARL